MAITLTTVFANSSASDASSYNTQSWTPEANVVYLVIAQNRRDGASAVYPVPSGNNLTWIKIKEGRSSDTNTTAISAYWAIGSSPTTGAIVLAAASSLSMRWVVIKVTNVNKNAPIVQSNAGTDATSPYAIALSSFADAVNNMVVGIFATLSSANPFFTDEAGYTTLNDDTVADSLAFLTAYKIGEDTSITATNGTNDYPSALIAFELAFDNDDKIKFFQMF